MASARTQAVVNRYVADLIVNSPPGVLDIQMEKLSPKDHVAMLQLLHRVKERMLAEAQELEDADRVRSRPKRKGPPHHGRRNRRSS